MELFLKILNFVANLFLYHFIIQYVLNTLGLDNLVIQIIGIALVIILPLVTTEYTFHYLKKKKTT